MIRANTSTAQETQLLDGAFQGNTEAFGQLVRMYQDRLLSSIMHMVQCRADAEDIVQDAFVQAYIKLHSFRRSSTFYTWLYRIAVNLTLSRGRKRRTRMSVEQSREAVGCEPLDPHGTPGDHLMRRERATQIEQALGALSDEHRTILVLRGVDGMDYEAIGQVLDLNPGTVRSRLHRARAQLRERLEEPARCGTR
jgi:RNA polymerase sigma-70 factor (ECF subfamily)